MFVAQAYDNNIKIIEAAAALFSAIVALIVLLTTGYLDLYNRSSLPKNMVGDYKTGLAITCVAFTLSVIVLGIKDYKKGRKETVRFSLVLLTLGACLYFTFNFIKTSHVVRGLDCYTNSEPVVVPMRWQYDVYIERAIAAGKSPASDDTDADAIASMLCESPFPRLREEINSKFMPMTAILTGLMIGASLLIYAGLTLLLLAAVAIRRQEPAQPVPAAAAG